MSKVIVTTSWDDGHKLDLKLAKLLKKYGLRGTFYIAPKNREFAAGDLLTARQIKKLSQNFEIGAHTITHPPLCLDFKAKCIRQARKIRDKNWASLFQKTISLSEDEARKEIFESKAYLEKLLGFKVTSFCYPDGRHNSRIQKIVEKAGFTSARTTEGYLFTPSDNHFAQGTTIYAHNRYLDMIKIGQVSRWNPLTIAKNLNWETLAKKMFDQVREKGGVYHLWGHSWEIDQSRDWRKLERVLAYIGHRKSVRYLTNAETIEAIK